jgi:hypothetical protein
MAPQARFLQLYLAYKGLAAWQAWTLAAALVVVPAAALATPGIARAFEPHERALAWASLAWGRWRLVALGVLLAWMFYLGEIYLAAWPWFGPWLRDAAPLGMIAGVSVVALAGASTVGLFRLRTWSIFGALACSVATACGALFARHGGLDAGYVGGAAGYAMVESSWAIPVAFAPLACLVALVWPILGAMSRHLRAT